MATIMTVLGPVESEKLGFTLAHEHLFIDLSCLWHEPVDKSRMLLVDAPICMENRALLSCDPYHSKDNLILDDLELAVVELGRFKSVGGGCLVDLSTRTIGPFPEKLKEASERSGVHIIAGTGFYTKKAHPDFVKTASVNELANMMISDLNDGFGESGVRAGIIGEIGTSSPLDDDEVKVLKAAAAASLECSVSVNVHLAIFAKEGHKVLDILQAENLSLNRVALSHLDETNDFDYQLSLAKRGAYIEFDCFGSEVHFDEEGLREPSDDERIDCLLALIEAGFEKQILLSQDVCTKMQLRHFGGAGYEHILRTIMPRLYKRGLDSTHLELFLRRNPERFLSGSEYD